MEHDLIRRSKLLAKKCMIRGHLDTGSPCPSKVKAVPVDVIEREPAVDAVPVRHGSWLNFYGDFSTAECDICAELYEVSPDESHRKEFFDAFKEFYKFCPNCGAKMDGGDKNDE